ncbi:MAG TPA: hypothetical protein VE735_02315 [Gammaproteobacteria bacterium]|nr:hypothetical protein [Gammaproteobacteria bacterium]
MIEETHEEKRRNLRLIVEDADGSVDDREHPHQGPGPNVLPHFIHGLSVLVMAS